MWLVCLFVQNDANENDGGDNGDGGNDADAEEGEEIFQLQVIAIFLHLVFAQPHPRLAPTAMKATARSQTAVFVTSCHTSRPI